MPTYIVCLAAALAADLAAALVVDHVSFAAAAASLELVSAESELAFVAGEAGELLLRTTMH